tara:strand:+ start:531 stop:779 length:249 start_codon:yes stop_codon:yes gene_type:complete
VGVVEDTDKILVGAQTVLQEALEAAQDLKIILEGLLLQVKDMLEETLQLIMSEVLEVEVPEVPELLLRVEMELPEVLEFSLQ